MKLSPERIICLTEESVELLFAIGEGHRIVGVSAFVKRPKEALKIKRVSAFTSANIDKICELKADLILGYSDIQKDIAQELIGRGESVFISNHRSIDEVLEYCLTLGRIVGQEEKTLIYIKTLEERINKAKLKAKRLKFKPKVYLEEWDEPMLFGIRYFSELLEICGAEDIFRRKSVEGSLGKDRITSSEEVISLNPDLILGCWCGKKVDTESIKRREGWEEIGAIKNDLIFELEPEVFLQPGPALIEEGISLIEDIFSKLKFY